MRKRLNEKEIQRREYVARITSILKKLNNFIVEKRSNTYTNILTFQLSEVAKNLHCKSKEIKKAFEILQELKAIEIRGVRIEKLNRFTQEEHFYVIKFIKPLLD